MHNYQTKMKSFFFFIIFKLLMPSLSVIPLWDFEASTIDLLSDGSSHTYIIYEENVCNSYLIKLKKTILREGNGISDKNYISINDNFEFEISWEDIDYANCINGKIYICPKGKNHMNLLELPNTITELIPNGFQNSNDWELKCFFHPSFNMMFIGYLNKHNKFYSYNFQSSNNDKWGQITEFNQGLYDFKWTHYNVGNYYPMKCIALDGLIKLQAIKFELSNSDGNINISKNTVGSFTLLNTILSYSNAFFNSDSEIFYFLTYDKNPPNFKSGFSLSDSIGFDNINSFTSSQTNDESPLDFYYNFTINQMNFIRGTKYVFYEINNSDKQVIYHGIIDIVLNNI